MSIGMFIVLIITWSLVGFLLANILVDSEGFEYVNPIWIYKTFRVNYFGVAVCCILLICLALLGLSVTGFINYAL